jgi:epoxyqueuosine reductase
LIRTRLNELCRFMVSMVPGSKNRGVVDTAPLMERDYAVLAGIGWIGKNTLLLHRKLGSYFFLAAFLTDVDLDADEPFEKDHCGTCSACLEACPTQAFTGPRVMDASRCISYLTIEHRGPIDPDLSLQMGDWIFGCDVCQLVCPWNRKIEATPIMELKHHSLETKQSIEHWLQLDEEAFRQQYRHTPFWRTRLTGMQRNAMIAAANTHRRDLIPLIRSFVAHPDDTLRQTCQWSLNQLGNSI